jgi:hypothetical protein
MSSCTHTTLELLPVRKSALRCHYCHLTLSRDELQNGFCPECFEVSGTRRYEFDEVKGPEEGLSRYRCADCGIVIVSK